MSPRKGWQTTKLPILAGAGASLLALGLLSSYLSKPAPVPVLGPSPTEQIADAVQTRLLQLSPELRLEPEPISPPPPPRPIVQAVDANAQAILDEIDQNFWQEQDPQEEEVKANTSITALQDKDSPIVESEGEDEEEEEVVDLDGEVEEQGEQPALTTINLDSVERTPASASAREPEKPEPEPQPAGWRSLAGFTGGIQEFLNTQFNKLPRFMKIPDINASD